MASTSVVSVVEATVSGTCGIVIPKEIWERAGIEPGRKVMIRAKGGVIELVWLLTLDDLGGFVEGIDRSNIRERGARL